MSLTQTDLPAAARELPVSAAPTAYYQIAALFLGALVFRLLFNACHELAPDEAYYWVWSRHLAMSYLDHPPIVAYFIWAATKLVGSTEFGVRLPAALLSAGTCALTTHLVYRLTRSTAATWLTAVTMVVSPVMTMTATLMTPDTPVIFFVMLGLYIGVKLFDDEPRSLRTQTTLWAAMGVCWGLAAISKYTGVLLPGAVFFVLLTSRSAWIEWRRPGIYLAIALAAIVALPVIVWNWRHDWASFRFQYHRGLNTEKVPGALGFLAYIGGLFLTWTPVLLVIAATAIFGVVRRFRDESKPLRLAAIMTLLPLLLFAYSSFHKKVEANWPAVAFAPAMVVVAVWASRNARKQRWVRVGWKLALAFSLVAHVPELALLAHLRISVVNDIFGWQQLAAWVDSKAAGAPVICSNYQNASELSFYMNGQPDVWSLNYERRPNAFDYFKGAPDLSRLDRAAFIGGDRLIIDRYFTHAETANFSATHLGRPMRTRTLTLADRPK